MFNQINTPQIGIEIGSDTLKIAISSHGQITNFVSKRLAYGAMVDGKISAPNDMAEIIKATLKEAGIRATTCAVVLPPQSVIGRNITMPLMSAEEYMLNLPFEFKDFIGKEGDKYLYDYTVKSVEGNSAEIYACAVLKSDVDVFYDITRKAGLKLKRAVPPEIAWLNLIHAAENVPNNLCIVDVGHTKTRVRIYAKGGFAMGREIEYAGRTLDEALGRYLGMDSFAARTRKETNLNNCQASECCTDMYADMATEITRTLKYYNDVNKDAVVRDLYYCGGCALIEPLRNAMIRATDLTPHHISRLVPGLEGKDETAICCAIAAGALI